MHRLVLLAAGFAVLLVNATIVSSGSGAQTGVRPVGKIAYAARGICVATADGRTRRCYLAGPFVADIYDSPAWSPDGRRIAFELTVGCGVPGGCLGIFVVNADGRDLHRVAPAQAVRDGDPTWSPRGLKIAFARWSLADGSSGIYVADADRARVRRLYQRLPGNPVETLSWSPDGRKIAFSDAGEHLYVMNADGSRVRELNARGADPRWSPNGRKLLVDGRTSRGDRALYVMNADGTLARLVAADAWDGAWSPDEQRIAFTCEGLKKGGLDICLVNSDGSGRLRLLFELAANDVTPAWSPNGQWISYVRYAFRPDGSTVPSIMVVHADSTGARIVAPVQVNGTPVWQPTTR